MAETWSWLRFFDTFFRDTRESLAVVLKASGCREGWLQGELFRAGRARDLRVNEFDLGDRRRADLYCPISPRMIAEIKIIGADYYAKQRYALDDDVQRLREATEPDLERYMILVIPRSDSDTTLGDHLRSVTFSAECLECDHGSFILRIWRL